MSKNPESTSNSPLSSDHPPSTTADESAEGGVPSGRPPESAPPGNAGKVRATVSSPRTDGVKGSPVVLRYAFCGLWFVIVPAILAWLTIEVARMDRPVDPPLWSPGWFRLQANDQWVPALIAAFSGFDFFLYRIRHWLPGAKQAEIGGRTDVPRHVRKEYEQAQHLLEEASRVLRKHRKGIELNVTSVAREDLTEALEELQDELERERFDEERFIETFDRAGQLFSRHLGRWRKSELREYSESIIVAVAVAFLLRTFVVEAFKIPSGSMLPTLQIQDHIFVNKLSYGPAIPFTESRLWTQMPPRRGDVMVFQYPEDRSLDFIKRVIALPGDKLEVEDGHPIINGWRVPSCKVGTLEYASEHDARIQKRGELDVEFLGDNAYLTLFEESGGSPYVGPDGVRRVEHPQGPYYVTPGEVWVLGDNRNNSADSRAWHNGEGAGVPFALIKGRAMFVWLSFSHSGGINAGRILHSVMGRPELPKDQASPELVAGIERCLANKPAVTSPPAP